MPRIFLYEFVTGGGTFSDRRLSEPRGSLLREGAAMVEALARDLLAMPHVELDLMQDVRLAGLGLPGCHIHPVRSAADERRALTELAARAEGTILIAPELGGHLLDRCLWVEAAAGRLLSPSPSFVRWASDKNRTADRLQRAGVPVPPAAELRAGDPLPADFPYPAVCKPPDGAGSTGIRFVPSAAAEPHTVEGAARLEKFCEGLPASAALLCGPEQCIAMPACRQRLSDDGRFRYLGGAVPLEAPLARRAETLALAAVRAMPRTVGYVGVDLILGDAPDGRQDVVIEINPRLTTSYVGLRRLARSNLAAAMVAVAQGRPVELSFSDQCVEFDADGQVKWDA